MRRRIMRDIHTLHNHSARSFFVYSNGNLFCQLQKYEICAAAKNEQLVFNMRGCIIHGKFVALYGTGMILTDWTIERK